MPGPVCVKLATPPFCVQSYRRRRLGPARTLTQEQNAERLTSTRPAKRQHVSVDAAATIERPPLDEGDLWGTAEVGVEELQAGPFLNTVEDQTVNNCISRFIDRTSNAALAKNICMSCARLLFVELVETSPATIPNGVFLEPSHPHPAHRLTDGMLLHRTGQQTEYICTDCRSSLVRGERPMLSLSNNMWTGVIPRKLSVLSLGERLLVARHFPAAYILKLYPQQLSKRALADEEDDEMWTNQALRGNITSYKLNTDRISSMISGHILPHPSSVLAATIGITFLGMQKKPLAVYPRMVYVKRARVRAALVWLKANNPLYANITICEERLGELPEDDVPDELRNNARFSTEGARAQDEHATYVPVDELSDDDEAREDKTRQPAREELFATAVDVGDESDSSEGSDYEGDVYPLQASAVLDTASDEVTDADLFSHAAENVVPHHAAREYGVRKGNTFVSEYARKDKQGRRFDGGPEDPNHLLGAFPFLFPYGLGGFEVDRDVNVPYESHVRWALQHHDKQFRKDVHFLFLVYSVVAKRKMCRHACLQIKRSSFIANQASFQFLQPADLIKAGEEEAQRKMISNPVVRSLRRQVTAVRAKVDGTDESRIAIRAQIWGMSVRFNPPTIWATLNLSDTGDPIAQVLAGEHIDLDAFLDTAGPGSKRRARTIARDPFASAEFFHLVVNIILEELFGFFKLPRKGILRRQGVLGVVNGYVGTVEAQAQGSLHLHILFWLQGAPTADVMKSALQTESFREKIKRFVAQNICAYTGPDDAKLKSRQGRHVAYSRPEDPRFPDYPQRRDAAEIKIARATQPHECKPRLCQRIRGGRAECKRRAPWKTSPEAWVDANGDWGPHHEWGYLNAWNPPPLQVGRCNQDMKLITNGAETKDIAFYITLYIAKKQIEAANRSALLAQGIAFHHKYTAKQKAFLSHNFMRIFWDEATWALRGTYPGIERVKGYADCANVFEADEQHREPVARVCHENGQYVIKDQLREYADRGHELDNMNMYDYFTFTYHGRVLPQRDNENNDGPDDSEADEGDVGPLPRRGRPPSKRVNYVPESNRKGCRVFRSCAMETVVHLVGRWLPRADDESREYYCAQVMLLLKPWRRIPDILGSYPTFDEAFEDFMATSRAKARDIIRNIQYFHDCTDAANERKAAARLAEKEWKRAPRNSDDDGEADFEHETDNPLVNLTEEDVKAARLNRYAVRETVFGIKAMDVAYRIGIFDRDALGLQVDFQGVERASEEELETYDRVNKQVMSFTRRKGVIDHSELVEPVNGDVVVGGGGVELSRDAGDVVDMGDPLAEKALLHASIASKLNDEQRLAHDIIADHLQDTMQGREPEQLLMIVRGEGGTGKTVLINSVSRLFDALDSSDILAKTATTGVAASLFGGQTLHSWAGILFKRNDNPSVETVEKRNRNILPTKYLIIDEYSMLTKQTLRALCKIMSAVKGHDGEGAPEIPFGGVNVILFGDPHQFPPPSNPSGALYNDHDLTSDGATGLQKYHQFVNVVTLTQQMRMRDVQWMEILGRLRHGACTSEDVEEVKKLLVNHEDCLLPDFSQAPWNDAVLVTPRHGARVRWNTASLERHAAVTGQRLYVCPAHDITSKGKRPLSMRERVVVASLPQKKTGRLEEHVEMGVGMKAMVLFNIATEADLANGTRGVIVDIKLDPKEPYDLNIDEDGRVHLRYPPAAVLFRPNTSSFGTFPGMEEGVIPILPSTGTFTIPTNVQKSLTIKRRQFAMTPGYAFTDYKSQGQTIERVIIDLADPPSGKLTPFSVYVALSRSRGRDTIRILRGFDETLFTRHPSEKLRAEDARLDALTVATKRTYAARKRI
uniref:ATP-dependent DNA helicase n=1 Tax=Mycena chlorophos TaxID=658473 RepID=A0ABQ0LDT4_MYCCL|nr:predicted protein [Mycena chlorophos]